MKRRQPHKQVPVKVTAFVDESIAPVVQVLNDIDGISTFSSCVGVEGKEYAHVYLDSGRYLPNRWLRLGKLAAKLAKILSVNGIYDSNICLVWDGDKDNPFIAIEFDQQYTSQIAKTLNAHKSELIYDT